MAAKYIPEAITVQRGIQERQYCCQNPHFQRQEVNWRQYETPQKYIPSMRTFFKNERSFFAGTEQPEDSPASSSNAKDFRFLT
jgi:hypothetical protein